MDRMGLRRPIKMTERVRKIEIEIGIAVEIEKIMDPDNSISIPISIPMKPTSFRSPSNKKTKRGYPDPVDIPNLINI
jgi:hypothetical protein